MHRLNVAALSRISRFGNLTVYYEVLSEKSCMRIVLDASMKREELSRFNHTFIQALSSDI